MYVLMVNQRLRRYVLMVNRRLRRLASIKTSLAQCLVSCCVSESSVCVIEECIRTPPTNSSETEHPLGCLRKRHAPCSLSRDILTSHNTQPLVAGGSSFYFYSGQDFVLFVRLMLVGCLLAC